MVYDGAQAPSGKDFTMSKKQTIEEKRRELELAVKRLDVWADVLESLENKKHWYMERIEETPEKRETYIDDDGNEKTRYIWATYKKDDDGNDIYIEPEPDYYHYDDYCAVCECIEIIKNLA